MHLSDHNIKCIPRKTKPILQNHDVYCVGGKWKKRKKGGLFAWFGLGLFLTNSYNLSKVSSYLKILALLFKQNPFNYMYSFYIFYH